MYLVFHVGREIYHFMSSGATTPLGLAIIFFLVALGEIGIPTPIIIEGSFLAVGVRLGHGMWLGFLLLGVTAVASLLGASIVYWLGMRGSGSLYRVRWFRKRIDPETVASAMRKLSQTSALTFAFVRFIPGLLLPASLAAGASRMRFRTFALGVLLSDLVWNGSMFMLGTVMGMLFPRAKSVHAFWLGVLIAVSIVGIAAICQTLLRRQSAGSAKSS